MKKIDLNAAAEEFEMVDPENQLFYNIETGEVDFYNDFMEAEVSIIFTRDGGDIKGHSCDCTLDYKNPPICRHVVAAVLAIQGGIDESKPRQDRIRKYNRHRQ